MSPSNLDQAAQGFLEFTQTLVSNHDGFYKWMRGNSEMHKQYNQLETAYGENLRQMARLQRNLDDEKSRVAAITLDLNLLVQEKGTIETKLIDAENQVVALGERLDSSAADFTDLGKKLEDQEKKIEKFQESYDQEKSKAAAAIAAENKVKQDLHLTRRSLEDKTADLERLAGFAFELGELSRETVPKRLGAMFHLAYKLARTFFFEDLDEDVLFDPVCWERLRNHKLVKRKIPLPMSNSLAAKNMRLAAVLAVLAEQLDQYIFQPTYLLEDCEELSDAMSDLASEDPSRERHLRAVLLSVLPEQQKKNARELVANAVGVVMSHVKTLLPKKEKREEFLSGLQNVCEQAREEWSAIQQLQEKVKPSFEVDAPSEWRLLPLPSEEGMARRQQKPATAGASSAATASVKLARPSELRDVVAPVWPIFIISSDGDEELLREGLVLYETQVRAAREEENNGPGTRRAARRDSRKGKETAATANGSRKAVGQTTFLSETGGGSNSG